MSHADWVAVLGGARVHSELQAHAAYLIGQELAKRKRHLVTGATTGLPYAAALGAKSKGAMVVGISPAESVADHVGRAGRPLRAHDFVVFSGMGADGRSPLIMRSAPAAVFVGGEMGTLLEFCAGWLAGDRVLGVLTGCGGMSDELGQISRLVSTTWGTQVIEDHDPVHLVDRVCEATERIVAEHGIFSTFEPPECTRLRLLLEPDPINE